MYTTMVTYRAAAWYNKSKQGIAGHTLS